MAGRDSLEREWAIRLARASMFPGKLQNLKFMPEIPKKLSHKFGANRNELAKKARKHDPNFAQSRDVHEDRGERQAKTEFRRTDR